MAAVLPRILQQDERQSDCFKEYGWRHAYSFNGLTLNKLNNN